MNEIVAKYEKPSCWMFFASRKITPRISRAASSGIAYDVSDRFARRGACAVTSVATLSGEIHAGGRRAPPGVAVRRGCVLPDEGCVGRDRLQRLEFLPDLLVHRDGREVRVARGVDREGAQDAVRDRGAEERLRRL